MNYTRININLKHPLDFWSAFSDSEERFFWQDSQRNKTVIGCEFLSEITEDAISDYPFVFYKQTFYEDVKESVWTGIKSGLTVFKHYYILTEDESYILSNQPESLPEFEDKPTVFINHTIVEENSPYSDWEKLFNAIQSEIRLGHVEKIVASREIIFTATRPFNIESIIENLIANNPDAFVFAYQFGGKTFLGASPEILIEKSGNSVLSYALAGTVSRTVENAEDFLLNDSKNLAEHRIVIDAIHDKMAQLSDSITVGQTDLMPLKNVYHLRTLLSVQSQESIITWARHLHPTPALGGFPQTQALDFLKNHENHERGLYASPIGLIDQNGDGTLVVGIRSALLNDNQLYAYAGCGIVKDSDCQSEYQETKIKLKTLLEAL
ncbi:MAG: isochorismate synthase [Streptococcaceae bacterium]|nr:isochorismate synthase [Streptococcaceae bacterium]